MSKHADPVDIASDLEMKYTEQYIAHARKANKPEQVQNPDGTWPEEYCIDCGEEIPTARLALGRVRCVECQTILEKKSKQIWG